MQAHPTAGTPNPLPQPNMCIQQYVPLITYNNAPYGLLLLKSFHHQLHPVIKCKFPCMENRVLGSIHFNIIRQLNLIHFENAT